MAASNAGRISSWHVGEFVLRYRVPIGVLLLAISAFFLYFASRVVIATRFVDFFPRNAPNVQLNKEFSRYGGAQTLILEIHVLHGDIYDVSTLSKIRALSLAVDRLPGVVHGQVFSLSSYRIGFEEAEPGGVVSKRFMYPGVPTTPKEIEELKTNVRRHRDELRGLVSSDNRSAIIAAAFNEQNLDYWELFKEVQNLVKRFEDENHVIHLAGEPIVRGYGYYYMPVIGVLFALAVAIMVLVLYLSGGNRTYWWSPIVTGSLSAVWGLGFVGLMGYNFDPVMLVIPFILTARDMSHGIQWQGRYYNELDRLKDKHAACIATTDAMLPPGFLSIVVDIAGIIFVAFGGIPALEHIAFGGSVWLLGSLTMVFVFQPILMSFLPVPALKFAKRPMTPGVIRRTVNAGLDRLISIPTTPGVLRGALLVGGAVFITWGVASGLDARIGYSFPGTPLYRPQAKVNQDIRAISQVYPMDEGWIIISTPPYPNQDSSIGPSVLRMMDDMRNYLLADRAVHLVISFSSTVLKPFSRMFHEGYPKYYKIPATIDDAGNLWYLFLQGTAPGEMEYYISHPEVANDTCIRLLLQDHTYDTLKGVQRRIDDFIRYRVKTDPALARVKVLALGGSAGLYAAANDVLYQLDFINITFVLGVVFLFSAFSFSSVVAGLLFIVSCVMANFGAFVYMNWRGIGLTIDTIPVISLGIGLGVDYGIYVVARISDEVRAGETLESAIHVALRHTGAAVLSTFLVMIGGILPWTFSPLLFHSQMSTLLILLMFLNMVSGCLILPSFIAWSRPRFCSIGGPVKEGAYETAAAR